MKRLAEHEAALTKSLSPDIRQYHTQLRSGGDLGNHLALELECLHGNPQCLNKSNHLKESLNQFPESVSEDELRSELQDTNSDLATALFSSIAPAQWVYIFLPANPLSPTWFF